MALRVLVDAAALRTGGGGTFIVEQLAALGERDGIELTVYASRETATRLRVTCGPSVRVLALPRLSLPRRLLYEQLVLPFRARGHDVVYQPGGFAMFASPRPQAVTNQNPHHFPASARAFWRARYGRRYRMRLELEWLVAHASVRRAEAFVAVSGAFCAAVQEDVGLRPNVRTIRSAAPRLPEPREGHGLDLPDGAPYVLTVAHDYPHKDWDGLIDAFLTHADLPHLVIVGEPRTTQRRLELERRLGRPDAVGRVTLLGRMTDRHRLAALYRGAACFVAHSFLEAGPLTPGEALASGLPVVASDIPPHREAAGAGGLYYDPCDPAALAATVRAALVRGRSCVASRDAREWTWADNAAALAEILRSIEIRG